MSVDKCRLCNREEVLQESHIIPKLIFRWLKRTSATGHLRSGIEINKRVQDGLKLPWLCYDCEQRLSKMESYFANEIFRPLRDGKTMGYNSNFLKFSVSLSWRVLRYFQEQGGLVDLDDKIIEASSQALLTWQDFLCNRKENPGKYEQHFYNFLGDISSTNKEFPLNIHRYLQRSVEIDVLSSKNIAFVYTKFPGLLFIGYIYLNNLSLREFRQTRIHVESGRIEPMSYLCPAEIWDIIVQKANLAQDIQSSISSKQQVKIDKDYRISMQRANQSETIKTLAKDINLFGVDLVPPRMSLKKMDTDK